MQKPWMAFDSNMNSI